MQVRRMMLVVGVLLSCVISARAEQVANPQFDHWTKFGEGSSATVTTTIDAGGQKMSSESTNKLTAKAEDNLTVEISGSMEVAGQKHTIPTQTQKVTKMVEKADAPQQVTEKTEKVEAAGKTFECKVYELTKALPNGQTIKAKTWMSTDVPGGVVKMEAKSETGNFTAVLKSFETK
ncbi:MAG TPA: hypothetical protein VL282_09455 [Tepidisphaeraceae bacterium]|nr:hypothetical protein [Tepidisphaeraceae bacterium]